jgi:hypothetical protein
MYTVYACETVTGNNMGPLDATVTSWYRELNGTDLATVTLTPGALTVGTRDQIRLYTTPWKMSIVICWNGSPVWAGPIVTRQWTSKGLFVNAAGIKNLLLRRKAHTWVSPFAAQILTYTNMSLGSIAQALVQLACSHPGGTLPITYPGTETDTDPTHTRTYNGFELKNIADLLTELTGVIGGPDIDFMPVWTDSTQTAISWTMRIGTLAQPELYSPAQVVFDAAQPGSSVSDLSYTEDASQMTTTAWAAGAGTDSGILMSQNTSTALTSVGFPLLEEEIDHKTVSTQATLDSYTAGDISTHAGPTVQWTLTVDSTQPPALSSFSIGDLARVRVANHIWIPDGDYPMRVTGISGDSSTKIKLNVQVA